MNNCSNNKTLTVGLAGFGTVGSGLVRILDENKETLKRRCGRDIRIKTVLVRDLNRKRAWKLPEGAKLCADMLELVNDPEIDVVIELMGGIEQAGKLVRAALNSGKNVITANKALLAEQGAEIFALAAEKGLKVGYEASVCGGIPIVQTLRDSLAANQITSLAGILNGTSNYILSAMTTEGLSFDHALKQAQELGFAEADPTLDVEGYDAAHKLTILIRLAWGVDYPFAQMPVEGIRSILPEDIQFAREFDYNIKLIGYAHMLNGQLEAGVHPTLVPKNYLMARVGHSYNAVRVEGNAVGSIFLHGLGAGSLPTGSAVAADLLELARGVQPGNLGFTGKGWEKAHIMPPHEAASCYYFRLMVKDTPGVLRDTAAVLASHNISVAQAMQTGRQHVVPLMFLTHEAKADDAKAALEEFRKAAYVSGQVSCFRVMQAPGRNI